MNAAVDADLVRFASTVGALLHDGADDAAFGAIDEQLHRRAGSGDTEAALRCAEIYVDLLSGSARPRPLAYALSTLLQLQCLSGDIGTARRTLTQLIDHAIEHGTPTAAHGGIEGILEQIRGRAGPDYVLHLLADVVRFYEHFHEIDTAVAHLLTVASLLGDYGAFQPAYHALNDAEQLARGRDDGRLLAQVYTTLSAVSLFERDLDYSIRTGEAAVELYRQLSEPIPPQLRFNLATAAMQNEDYAKARAIYTTFLEDDTQEGRRHEYAARINLSICRRNSGDLNEADEELRLARIAAACLHPGAVDPEQWIELELVATANAIASVRFAEAMQLLRTAAQRLDAALSIVDKLHFRRALRERYVSRIESLFCDLPDTGEAAPVLDIIACTRANQLSDWLHLLDWADELATRLDEDEQTALARDIDALADFGAPFLFGYREKYDDPFDTAISPAPWRAFAERVADLRRSVPCDEPLASARLTATVALLRSRLDAGYAVLVSFLSHDSRTILLSGQHYLACRTDPAQTEAFYVAVQQLRHGQTDSRQFAQVLRRYQSSLLSGLAPLLELLAEDGCKGVMLLPHRLDVLPLNQVLLGHERLRARMSRGDFHARTCVALHPQTVACIPPQKPAVLLQEPTDLKLPRAQFDAFCSVFGANGVALVNASGNELAARMSRIDTLIVAQHGVSIGLYNDPYFATLAGPEQPGALSFEQIQRYAFRWPHQLVMLSACHSGSLISRNAQTSFRSHELIGYPSVLLANRRSVVSAASWPTIDKFDYLLSVQFALELRANPDSSAAFSKAIATLVDMTAEQAMSLFRHIPDATLRDETTPHSAQQIEQLMQMKSDPFCYGAYQLYTLF